MEVEHILNREDGKYELSILNAENILLYPIQLLRQGVPVQNGFPSECKIWGINLINNQVDIGVRVELPAAVFEHITDVVYEAKLVYRTKQYGDSVRTFCMNPYGHVVTENVDGIITVNGHSYSDASLRSENTNFALLVSKPFHTAVQRAVSIRKTDRFAFQYARRRCTGTALRRFN